MTRRVVRLLVAGLAGLAAAAATVAAARRWRRRPSLDGTWEPA